MKITTLSTTAFAAILSLALTGLPVNAQTTSTTTSSSSTSDTTTPPAKPAKVKKNKDAKTDYKGTVTAIDTKATPNTLTISTSKKDPSKTLTLTLASTTVFK